MFSIKNDLLSISVKKTGAELCKITSEKHATEFMWNANPDVWSGFAPNLFPIIGALKNNSYFFNNKKYSLPKHGFLRNNSNFTIHKVTENNLSFKLSYDEELLKIYPFKFEFYISYTLNGSTIEVSHTVKNLDDKTMYFSLGGHPAFKCPVFNDEDYSDYFLEFEHSEASKRHLINLDSGLANGKTRPVFNQSNILPLNHDMFHEDAFIFKDLKSKTVFLKSKKHGTILSFSYDDFPYLGIWAKPTGNYVCIEPWLGIADNENTDQDFTTKEGILSLTPKDHFSASYTIEIHNSHLV